MATYPSWGLACVDKQLSFFKKHKRQEEGGEAGLLLQWEEEEDRLGVPLLLLPAHHLGMGEEEGEEEGLVGPLLRRLLWEGPCRLPLDSRIEEGVSEWGVVE